MIIQNNKLRNNESGNTISWTTIVGSLRDREVACSASDRQGSNFESCVWRTVSSQSSHHPQEVLLAQLSLYVHKVGLNPDSFHFHSRGQRNTISWARNAISCTRNTISCERNTISWTGHTISWTTKYYFVGKKYYFVRTKYNFVERTYYFVDNEILFRGQEILFRGQEIIFRGQERIFRANEILFRGKKYYVVRTKYYFADNEILFRGQRNTISWARNNISWARNTISWERNIILWERNKTTRPTKTKYHKTTKGMITINMVILFYLAGKLLEIKQLLQHVHHVNIDNFNVVMI